jgi:ABC-type branched-subunit amino acid transport system permease subunit
MSDYSTFRRNESAFARFRRNPLVGRALACLFGGFVLALMVGNQEGSQTDALYAFKQAVFHPRILIFLGIGVLAFVLITFWPSVVPYLTRPGAWPLIAGIVTVFASLYLLHWNDKVGNAKFGDVASAVGKSTGTGIAGPFFGWLYIVQLALAFLLCATAIATRRSIFGYAAALVSVVAAIISYLGYHKVVTLINATDHSTGVYVSIVGYLVIAAAGLSAAVSTEQVSQTKQFLTGIVGWRPGLALVIVGVVLGVISMAFLGWFSPGDKNAGLSGTHTLFSTSSVSSWVKDYLTWLGWTLLIVATVLAGAGAYLRSKAAAWAGTLVGAVGCLLTVVMLYKISKFAASIKFDGATGPWQNLGVGGWVAGLGLFLIGSGGFVAATTNAVAADFKAVLTPSKLSQVAKATGQYKTLILAGLAFALFYPPTATDFWQKVLVTEIGVYVLLAVGLNVVVGWAGLLDLGFIAFFAIGSYTASYLVGALPVQPPSWLHMSPLLAIPFAVAFCLIAGITLGAPTLRLRGDYLAIVTLGFGEIIRIIAVNNPGNFTNGPRGAPSIPHPVIHLGGIHLVWGLDSLPYWYLLVVIVIIVVALFYRLEGSRIGRAWAAVREDEVAAQATGINTTRIKLLAFAIGASTSGIAGVFFATQVGYINPDNFVLNNSILVVAYVVFGGMGSLPGAMAGAAVLTWLPEFLKDQVPADDRQMWIGAVVLLMMIFRPEGLIPARRRKAELTGFSDEPSAETIAVPASEGL